MSNGSCMPSLASNCIWYASLEKCIVASGGIWFACRLIGITFDIDSKSFRRIVALHRATNWIDYAYGIAWIGCQVSESDAYAIGFFNWWESLSFSMFNICNTIRICVCVSAMQLHDFSEMQAFPTKLRYMCICLSEVIFMEGFMRKIYNFINGLEVLHLIGTYEKVEEEEEEIYEVINVHKLKSATPNLRVINLYGINFIDDSHIDAFSSNCIQVNLCRVRFTQQQINYSIAYSWNVWQWIIAIKWPDRHWKC